MPSDETRRDATRVAVKAKQLLPSYSLVYSPRALNSFRSAIKDLHFDVCRCVARVHESIFSPGSFRKSYLKKSEIARCARSLVIVPINIHRLLKDAHAFNGQPREARGTRARTRCLAILLGLSR